MSIGMMAIEVGGHGFIDKNNAGFVIPGATLGHDIFGDNIAGDVADLLNPLSDIQDIINDIMNNDEPCI